MECTLATLIACFSWSGLYVDSGVSFVDSAETVIREDLEVTYSPGPDIPFETRVATKEDRFSRNPYGVLSIGYQVQMENFSWRLQASHRSSLKTDKDRGSNAIEFYMRWQPFKSR